MTLLHFQSKFSTEGLPESDLFHTLVMDSELTGRWPRSARH